MCEEQEKCVAEYRPTHRAYMGLKWLSSTWVHWCRNEKDCIFPVTKSCLHYEMCRGGAALGVKQIRIHVI